MMCRGVVSGGDTVCGWTMDVNIFNNQSWADSKGWSSRLGVEFEWNSLQWRECYKMLHKALGLESGRIIDGLV